MELRGKRVLITGASRGIGESLARAFVRAGATVEVNYLAPAELCRRAIPRMLRRGDGHIVNIPSIAGCAVVPGLVAYSASKAALSHFTAGLRADLRGLPIGTTLVELGPIPTDMLAHDLDYEPTAKSFRRFYRMRAMVDVPREKVADEVVEGVQKGRRHVRIPKRNALYPLLSEAPRRTIELLLTGVPHQAK